MAFAPVFQRPFAATFDRRAAGSVILVPTPGFGEHWRADDLALSDGDPVAAWTGVNGVAANAGAGVPVYKSNQINGLPCVRFTRAASTQLFTASSAAFAGSAATVLALCKLRTAPNYTPVRIDFIMQTSGTSPNYVYMYLTNTYGSTTQTYAQGESGGAGIAPYINGAATATAPPNNIAPNAWYVLSFSVASIANANRTLTMGYRAIGGYADVDIAELLYYKTALSTADRQQTEQYLLSKYAL